LEREEGGRIKGRELFEPTAHMFYGTRVLDVPDALGKWEGYQDKSERLG
jgi:hypothetical protein